MSPISDVMMTKMSQPAQTFRIEASFIASSVLVLFGIVIALKENVIVLKYY
jgi:hypothetical protein